MRIHVLIIFQVALFISASRAFGAGKLINSCGTKDAAIPFDYCVSKTAGSKSRDVVYYFHGGPGDSKEWITQMTDIQDAWREMKAQAPIVVAISFGPQWLLVSKNESQLSGQYEVFFKEAVPYIENTILQGRLNRRRVIGLSMGGFSAAQVLTRNSRFVDRVALLCPMLVNVPPDATREECSEFQKRSRVPSWDPCPLMEVVKTALPKRRVWEQESPFELARKNLNANSPKTYLSFGTDDHFVDGIFEFGAIASGKETSIELKPVAGGHCNYDVLGVAKFLSE